jgi:hypothetical protein
MVGRNENRLIEKRDIIHLVVLVVIALAIGIYLIATTVLISKDGVFYIERAQQFTSNPIEIIQKHPPGYPFLILSAHKFVAAFSDNTSNQIWIYSAQSITLLCRLFAIIPLYFMGKLLVSSKNSFWAMLILIFMPYPTRIVCDVLREWPYLLCLATGFFFLLWAAKHGKWWALGLVGLSCGLGYLIRPESAQLAIYGLLWIVLSLFRPKLWGVSRWKTLFALELLLVGFAISAVPYIVCIEKIIPTEIKHIMKSFSFNTLPEKTEEPIINTVRSNYNTAEIIPPDILKALAEIFKTVGESMMWFFVPMLCIGLYHHFRLKRKFDEESLILIFLLVNITMIVLRYCYVDPHISQRWSLALIAFTVFYIPIGLSVAGDGLKRILPEKKFSWFSVLLLIGICICLPKLLGPIRKEKQGYRNAAEWLMMNTARKDIIAATDKRISFYAEREGHVRGKEISVNGGAKVYHLAGG